MPSRRAFLVWSSVTIGLGLAGAALFYRSHALKPSSPFLSGGYAPIADEISVDHLEISGEIPRALRGQYLRNGPNAAFPRVGYKYWDGDGMIHSIRLTADGAAYRNRFIETPYYLVEKAKGESIYANPWAENPPVNRANTGVFFHHGKTLVTSVDGPTMQIDPQDLSTVGVYDFEGQWKGFVKTRYRIDPKSGDLFLVGLSSIAKMTVLRFDANGKKKSAKELEIQIPGAIYDLAITEHDILLFWSSTDFKSSTPARVGILPMEGEKSEVKWIDLTPGLVHRVFNAYEKDGLIFAQGLRGEFEDNWKTKAYFWEIDPSRGTAKERALSERPFVLPTINPAMTGKPYRYVYLGGMLDLNQSQRLRKMDVNSGENTVFEFGEKSYGDEFTFVADPARPGQEDGGWLVGFVSDPKESFFMIVDAATMKLVARVRCPQRVPYGISGVWIPQ